MHNARVVGDEVVFDIKLVFMSSQKSIMRADWSELVALNFHCDPNVLQPLIPTGLELDYYNDDTFITIVAARLKEVYVWSLPFAIGHEVDLVSMRFYVRRLVNGVTQERGVCNVKSFVSTRMAAWCLGRALKSSFVYAPFKIENTGFLVHGAKEDIPVVDYKWRADGENNHIRVKARHRTNKITDDSINGFLLNRDHWYVNSKGGAKAFNVSSSSWKVWDAAQASFTCDARSLFGSQFSKYITRRPANVFLCEKSAVSVFPG